MPELRKDPVVGRWVIIATERARRPSDFAAEPVRARNSVCAFCAGQEAETPPQVLAGRTRGLGREDLQRIETLLARCDAQS